MVGWGRRLCRPRSRNRGRRGPAGGWLRVRLALARGARSRTRPKALDGASTGKSQGLEPGGPFPGQARHASSWNPPNRTRQTPQAVHLVIAPRATLLDAPPPAEEPQPQQPPLPQARGAGAALVQARACIARVRLPSPHSPLNSIPYSPIILAAKRISPSRRRRSSSRTSSSSRRRSGKRRKRWARDGAEGHGGGVDGSQQLGAISG